jgi:hypothetical protein
VSAIPPPERSIACDARKISRRVRLHASFFPLPLLVLAAKKSKRKRRS